MKTITIKPAELKAVALASSKESVRYYLNGVCIETYDDGSAGMIATDGHRLHAINVQKKEQPVTSFILDSIAVKKALIMAKAEIKNLGKRRATNVLIRIISEDNVNLTIEIIVVDKDATGKVIEFTCKAIDGNFPDWRRIIPNESHENVENDIAFNCAYMVDFGKACEILTGNKSQCVKLSSAGRDGPILVNINYDAFTGALMPMRF